MEGNDFVWLVSIILGMTLVAWLVLDWLESAQRWDTFEQDTTGTAAGLGSAEHSIEPLDAEMELMLCYPLDPFAPSLLWRPTSQDGWIEGQEQDTGTITMEPSPNQLAKPIS